jgi:hypothetical protein
MSTSKAEVATQQEVVECAADLKDLLKRGSLVERKAFVRGSANEARVAREQVLVNYTIPTSLSRPKEERNPALDIIRYGGR